MFMNEIITSETFHSIENLEVFIEQIDPESYLARVMLEYLVINSKSDLLERLIDKLMNSSSEESRVWAEVYQIDHLVYKQEMSLIEATKQLTYNKVNSCELATLIKVFQLYNYYDLKNFEMIHSMSSLVNVEIKKIDEGFMKHSLVCRHMLVMQGIHLQLNELKESRICGTKLLEVALTPTMKVIAYRLLGNSFILRDKDKALNYLKQSLQIAEEIGHSKNITASQISINFTYCYWGEPEKVSINIENSSSLGDYQGYAYYLIQSNKKEEALKILQQIELKIDSDYLKGFDYYYRGLINNNKSDFEKSNIYFKLAGDNYFRQLPLMRLSH